MSISNAGYPWYTPYSPYGMQMVYTGATTFTVSVGNAPNSDFKNIIKLTETVTVDITKSGINGLDAGTIAASTKYYVFVIASSNNPVDDNGGYSEPTSQYPAGVILSTSATPSLPFNYDMYRRIGFIYTDSGVNITTFRQSGNGPSRTIQYVAQIPALTGGVSATYATVDLSSAVPLPGMVALLSCSVTPTAAGDALNIASYGDNPTIGNIRITSPIAGVVNSVSPLQIVAGNNGGNCAVSYKVNGSASINVVGYIDTI